MGPVANESVVPDSPVAPQGSLQQPPTKWVSRFFGLTLASSTLITCLLLSCSRETTNLPPKSVILSTCPESTSDAYRIKTDFGLRFVAPENVYAVRAARRDMPPEMVYEVKLRGSNAKMVIAWRDDDVLKNLTIAYPMFSQLTEERNIRDAKGRIWGTDRWGYLRSGERWRYVKFTSGYAAGYEPTTDKQADLLDQIIDSACFAPDKNIAK
jgi:hypothetical protein